VRITDDIQTPKPSESKPIGYRENVIVYQVGIDQQRKLFDKIKTLFYGK